MLDDDRILVSNVASGTDDQDGTGYISLISAADGSIIEEKWAEDLDRPFGMAIKDSTLYVSDRTVLRTFNVDSGEPGPVLEIGGAQSLNDVTTWQGTVYVSDPRGNAVHRIGGTGSEVWAEGPAFEGVNGILGDGDRLLLAGAAEVFASADTDGNVTVIADGFPSGDGIGILEDGGHLVSNWRGELVYVSPAGETTSLVNTRDEGIEQNDLLVTGDLAIVPNWSGNSLTAWRVSW